MSQFTVDTADKLTKENLTYLTCKLNTYLASWEDVVQDTWKFVTAM